MTTRQRPANRRASENFTFELDGLRYTATVSRMEDGRMAELFLNNHKAGNQSDTNARDAAGKATGPVGAALDILAGR